MSDICAISTPLAEGGISVIRISGENALTIAEKMFRPISRKSVSDMGGYTCAYGDIVTIDGEKLDDGVLTIFRAPKSYTGENVCEISCHGGIFVTKKVLRLCVENGCIPAQRGEFTKRAFLNGKMSLTQAESVTDIIAAQGEYALRSSELMREGKLFGSISKISEKLVKILGELAAWVDYPEEDLPEIENGALSESLLQTKIVLKKILDDYDSGMVLKNGVDTVIAGKPNVGKSTLMNMLLGYERSIVTDVAGTTRDVIEETAKLGELVLKISDTAGLHETCDCVEKVGVELARKKLAGAQLIIAVFDLSVPLDDEDKELLEYVKNRKHIIVLNKSDLDCKAEKEHFDKYGEVAEISAKSGTGRDEIQQLAEKLFSVDSFDADSTVFANERQKECAERAYKYIVEAENTLSQGETLDAVTVLIDYAEEALMELTGEKTTEAVVDEVFSKFCVGK